MQEAPEKGKAPVRILLPQKQKQVERELRKGRIMRDTAQLEAANKELRRELAERQSTERILRENEERFRLLVDGVRDYAIYMLDPRGRIVSWDAGAERIDGSRVEEVLGRYISCFRTEGEDVKHGQPAAELRAALAGRLETEGWRVRKDGSRFWV
ncbi:MAG: PAS domain S-box protein, partial [Terriglobia bacterium]